MSITHIHHLNCGTGHPVGAGTFVPELKDICCRVLLVETPGGLVLVDAGPLAMASHDTIYDRGIDKVFFRFQDIKECAVNQLHQKGYKPDDVKHIILTHLDQDHLGGIVDFPKAIIHLTSKEFTYKNEKMSTRNRFRYRKAELLNNRMVKPHAWASGESWHGFEYARPLDDSLPEIAMISLPGHTIGHCGVAIEMPEARIILHAGDAFYHPGELLSEADTSYGFKQFRRLIDHDHQLAMENVARLRTIKSELGERLNLVCSHAPVL